MTNPQIAELRDARILVVGTGPMGAATARLALAAGARVTLAGRSAERLSSVAAGLGSVETVVADTEDPDQTAALMTGAAASSIPDTALANAKAAFGRLWLTYNVLRTAAGTVRPGGSVCVLSGSSGRRPLGGFGVWGTLHGSIESLARSAAVELAPVRVNVVSPGGIGIRMDRQLIPHAGVAEDVANMVCSLMANPAVTNAVVDVDGGERLGSYPTIANAWESD